MNFIQPKYEILEQNTSELSQDQLIQNVFKHIEICGRTCYKSEDKITEDSYKKFVENLEKSNHGAMLEHGTVYLTIGMGTPIDDPQYMWKMDIIRFFQSNKYSVVNSRTVNQTVDVEIKGFGMKTQASAKFYFITTNWRVIYENRNKDFCKYFLNNYHIEKENLKESILQWITPPTEDHVKRYTVKFTCHLAVARDFNRHRVQSVGEESTRYCNYSKDKYGNELKYILPVFLEDNEKEILANKEETDVSKFEEMCKLIGNQVDNAAFDAIDYFVFALQACEYAYIKLTKDFKWTAQKASLILPLDTKTESVHTAFAHDWAHYFNLRALGTTGSPRPSAKEVAWPLMEEFIKNGWINENDIDTQKYYNIKANYPNIQEYIKK